MRLKRKSSVLKKASQQAYKNITTFKKLFQPYLSEEWKFITAVCVPNLEFKKKDTKPCNTCCNFILEEKEMLNMKQWIQQLDREYEVCNNGNDLSLHITDTICLSLIKKALYLKKIVNDPGLEVKQSKRYKTFLHKSEKIDKMLGLLEHSKQTENMLASNTTELEDQDNYVLIIAGDYGVGKTYALQERAKNIAWCKETCKLAYLNLSSYDPQNPSSISYMDLVAKNMFKDFENVDVITYKDLSSKPQSAFESSDEDDIHVLISKYFQEHVYYTHIYIDELPRPNKQTPPWNNFFLKGKYYCVTLKVNPSIIDNTQGKHVNILSRNVVLCIWGN